MTDAKARVLSRVDTARPIGLLLDGVSFAPGFSYAEGHLGTNGVGTVFESGQPVHIMGPEHFHERLQPFSCAGAPVRDPLTGRIEGVLDISCLTEHANPLMHSMVRSAAQDIERNLLLDRSQCQQALFETFVRVDSRSREAVMAVSGNLVMCNSLAQTLFDPVEQRTIQEHARYLMAREAQAVDEIELTTGKIVRMRGTRIVVGVDVAGMVVEVTLRSENSPPMTARGHTVAEVFSAPSAAKGDTGSRRHPLLGLKKLSGSGQSPSWKRACTDISAALAEHNALLVMGETGTGKFSLVTEIYHSITPGGRSVLIDAVDISHDSHTNAVEAMEATPIPTLYIFRNIDALSTAGVERLDTFLQALTDSERPAYLAATLSDANINSDLPFREVLVHFQQAVTVPPLRHRIDDIPTVVSQLLARLSNGREIRVSPAAMRVICRYTWPRNIHQLEEALRAALIKRPVGDLQPEDLPGYCHNASRRQLTGLESIERDAIVRALHDARGNRMQAAAALGIARSSLYRKLKCFGIETI
ncbi:helix-turn-helix domain-containing protein [Streptomyces sp. NPDC005202]|uniref:sigma-54-dependent Fis family transcriptional regulator n=1 Tax=Streptomyces sp. NPDC005202 TaxID=3157021 RepID=UPI0033AC7FE9